jgi:hypothetical protein
MHRDSSTGQFAIGNPGRPKGIRNKRVEEWETLKESILSEQVTRFQYYLDELWESDREKWAYHFHRILEYFKPKLTRTNISEEPQEILITIVRAEE